MPGPNTPYTKLDANQVLQQSFDEANDRLRVDASVTATIGDLTISAEESDIAIKDRVTDNLLKINADGSIDANVNIDAASGDSIKISDGVDTLAVNPDGSINTVVAGVATAANQVTEINSLSSIDSKIPANLTVTSNRLLVDGSGVTQPVSVASLPLPTGAATEAKQDSQITQLSNINSSLTSIDAGIPAALGQTTMSQSMPVVIASNQTAIPVSGPLTDSELRASPVPVSATLADEPIKISGTENGSPSGTEYTFVNNQRLQVLASKDRVENYTYADFGTKNQRITQVDYTSSTISGFTVRRVFNYTLVGTRYRRDNSIWSIV